ncbi:MAG TPA: hypothetical protein VM618_04845, partial [Acidimicrobiia bacterium]|nr:hypothetical protein [Acidimicrobiia bacterium]
VQAAAGVLRHGVDVPGLAVAIHKAIPAEAGLGGGSADAAAVLVALQHLLDDAPSDEAMLEIAAAIGSDVPACFMGGLMRMTGRGEDVKQLTPVDGWVAVVAVPSTRLSTATVYRAWSDLPAGTRPREIEAPAALRDLADVLVNDLEPAALLVDPELARFRDAVRDAAGVEPLLAGSGSAYVVVVDASIGSEVMAASISAALAADGFAPRLVAAGAPAQRGVDLLGEG